MTQSTPNILILGGGVAGMAAARTFSDQDVAVHLVEKSDAFGGHAAQWACMATDTCENCGACLSLEMADQVAGQANVTSYLNTTLDTISPSEDGWTAKLSNNESIHADKVIMATGFSPFDPVNAPSLNSNAIDNVITTAQLNTYLKEETISARLNDNKSPNIAFLQCIGSRNRDQGRDYCSQVCCKISMRHAKKLVHLYPDASVTLFYMDLQVIGKEARTLFTEVSDKVSLVQGVPAEILEHPESKLPTIVMEQDSARVQKSFDMIVLSVGMQPADNVDNTCKTLNMTPNKWGFFNTADAGLADNIQIAGCSRGPGDILGSIQQGKIAADKVIRELGLSRPEPGAIAVFGNGKTAADTVDGLIGKGYKTLCFSDTDTGSGADDKRDLNRSRILSVSGTAGNFSILYQGSEKKEQLSCAAIISAQEPLKTKIVPPGLENTVLSLAGFAGQIKETADSLPKNIAVLLDYAGPENKAAEALALETAVTAAEAGKTVSIILNKILVNGARGQQQYDTARQKGIDFFRYNTPDDLFIKDAGSGFHLAIKETTLPGITLNLECDCLVIPEQIRPAPEFGETAALLAQSLDKEGFLQSANVRHRIVGSPRKGIFFIGGGHDEADRADIAREMDEILSALRVLNPQSGTAVSCGVEINQKKCAQCLTCIRICPHNAIVINEKKRPEIVPDACFSCHLCVANCPAYAIESETLANDRVADTITEGDVAVLACERSAALAADALSLPDHVTLIKVPCACRISPDIILRLLIGKAAKVIIAGCHEENCQSVKGSSTGADAVKSVLKIPGTKSSNILWQPIAANETRKLEHILSKGTE